MKATKALHPASRQTPPGHTRVKVVPANASFHEAESVREAREKWEIERLALEGEHRALDEARHSLEVTRRMYVELYEFAPVGIATPSAHGVVKTSNRSGAQLFGFKQEF